MNRQAVCYSIDSYTSNAMLSDNPNSGVSVVDKAKTIDQNGGNPACNQGGVMIVNDKAVFDSQVYHGCKEFADGISQTVNAQYGTGGNNQPLVVATMQGIGDYAETGVASSLKQRDYKDATDLVCRIQEDNYGTTEGDKVLRLLWKTYGEKEIFQWGIAILERIQSPEVLQSGMYESCIQRETEDGNELDGSSLPCPATVAEWILRDMRKQQECGCSSQRWESSEQFDREPSKTMSELSYESPSSAKEMFDLWRKGEGIGILQQTLHSIQKIRESSVSSRCSVRRLTPLEAERLQGFPDGWTALPGASDSARYKALGNSIARPFWTWLAKRFVDMGGVKTIGSLFDGISGFVLCFAEAGAETLWTSEIEPFCRKVVEYHFGKENEDDDRR